VKDKESFSNLLKADVHLTVKGFKDKVEKQLETPESDTALARAMKRAVSNRNMRIVRNLFKKVSEDK
jgi:hypothetical protein